MDQPEPSAPLWMALGGERMDVEWLFGDTDIFMIFAVCFSVELKMVWAGF